jgi:hypothetical protein
LARKQHGKLHLLRPIASLTNPREGLGSWIETQALRKATERGDGYPDLPTLLRFSELNYAQLVHLLPEYGDVNINADQLDEGRVWRGSSPSSGSSRRSSRSRPFPPVG